MPTTSATAEAPRLRKAAAALALAVFFVYAWAGVVGYRSPCGLKDTNRYYNLQTDAFLARRLDFPITPEPVVSESTAWANKQEAVFRLGIYDLDVYRGKVYMYWGAAPVVTLYLPVRLLLGLRLPDSAAVTLFAFGAWAWGALLLARLLARHRPSAPGWTTALWCAALAFATPSLFVIRFSRVYEVAIAAGQFFMWGGLYFLVSALDDDAPAARKLFAAGLFFGLAVASRPNLFLPVPILFGAALFRIASTPGGRTARAAALLAPAAACFAAAAAFNYARFENFVFAKGALSSLYAYGQGRVFSLSRYIANFYFYVFQPPTLDGRFPFAHLRPALPSGIRWMGQHNVLDAVGGLLPTVPLTFVPALASLVRWARRPEEVPMKRVGGPVGAALLAAAGYYFGLRLLAAAAEIFVNTQLAPYVFEIGRFRDEVPFAAVFFLALAAILTASAWRRVLAGGMGKAAAAVGTAFAVLFFFVFFLPDETMRYAEDYVSLAVFSCAAVFFHFDGEFEADRAARAVFWTASAALAAASIWFGLAFGIERYWL